MTSKSSAASASPDLNGRTSVAEASNDVSEQLSALKADFAGLAAAIQTLTGAGADVAKDTAKTKLAAAGESGEAAARHAIERANEGTAALANYAREKPMMALAAAAGAGLLIGYLTAPRK